VEDAAHRRPRRRRRARGEGRRAKEVAMRAWRKICCPVDFSETSRRAAASALELAWAFGGKVTLVHVAEPIIAPAFEGGASTAPSLEGIEPRLRDEIRSWARALPGGEAVDVVVLMMGSPAEEIARFARDGDYDAVVMGTHGRTGLKHLVLGSVAERVVRHASCPVVVVRGG
jgi:nucleotide-binding universal stress UspA family protein